MRPIFLSFLCVVFAGAALAQESGEGLGARLAELRTRIDDLTAAITATRADLASELRSLGARKADLELEIARLESRTKSQERSKAEFLQENAHAADTNGELLPMFEAMHDTVRASVERGIPFKRKERLDELESLKTDLSAQVIGVEQALSRLWQFVEDDLRLAEVSELHQQQVEIDGEVVLADVVHLGMVELFFLTSDGLVGRAVERSPGGYEFERITDRNQKEAIELLFDRMRKQVRSGYVELPLQSFGGAEE